jgi:hypothetical protein
VNNPSEFIPIHYSGDSILDRSQLIRIASGRTPAVEFGPYPPNAGQDGSRYVLLTLHGAQVADFEAYQWLLQHGSLDSWYAKPNKAILRRLVKLQSCGSEVLKEEADEIRLGAFDTPMVWAAAPLTTPTDDDIFDCSAGHSSHNDYTGACHKCTDERTEAIESTPLVYYLVIKAQRDGFSSGPGKITSKPLYTLVTCGSREAAAVQAFYTAGVNGHSVVFSCVLRVGETFDDRNGPIERVDELWKLSEDAEDEDVIRVFY